MKFVNEFSEEMLSEGSHMCKCRFLVSNKEFCEICENPPTERLSWDNYFIKILKAVSERGTCNRGKSGCIFTRDNRILVTGYVGSPPGFPHCDEEGHLLKKVFNEDNTISEHCVRTVHAEINAICDAAKRGISLECSTVYVTMTPCRSCAMALISCDVARIVCLNKYQRAQESEELFEIAKIPVFYINEEVLDYSKKD